MASEYYYFNPRSPWGERPGKNDNAKANQEFQSTLPVGGATWSNITTSTSCSNFNPRSPWGERRLYQRLCFIRGQISIHAPRGGSDHEVNTHCPSIPDFNPRSPWGERLQDTTRDIIDAIFQSTLPVGGATLLRVFPPHLLHISIHAPRGGSDPIYPVCCIQAYHFNPRSPWGERQAWNTIPHNP